MNETSKWMKDNNITINVLRDPDSGKEKNVVFGIPSSHFHLKFSFYLTWI